MRAAGEAFDFEIGVTGVESVTQRRRWLGRTLKAEHSLVPGFTGEPIGDLARLGGTLRRCPDRGAVDCLA